jgi:hypothetical protein
MNKQTAKRDLLWQAYERSGLWEAPWSLQTIAPELWGKPAIDLAHSLLRDLVLQGLVYLYHFNEETREERPVSPQDAMEILTMVENWNPPSTPEQEIWFAITEQGEAALRKLEAASKA